jgi:hypothetical protein
LLASLVSSTAWTMDLCFGTIGASLGSVPLHDAV